MLKDIVRFNRSSPTLLTGNDHELTLGDYVDRGTVWPRVLGASPIPMGAAIWSAPPSRMRQFPIRYFVQFCSNHGLLSLTDRPQ